MTATVDDANVITNDSHWTVDGQAIVFAGAGQAGKVAAAVAPTPKATASTRTPTLTVSAPRPR